MLVSTRRRPLQFFATQVTMSPRENSLSGGVLLWSRAPKKILTLGEHTMEPADIAAWELAVFSLLQTNRGSLSKSEATTPPSPSASARAPLRSPAFGRVRAAYATIPERARELARDTDSTARFRACVRRAHHAQHRHHSRQEIEPCGRGGRLDRIALLANCKPTSAPSRIKRTRVVSCSSTDAAARVA